MATVSEQFIAELRVRGIAETDIAAFEARLAQPASYRDLIDLMYDATLINVDISSVLVGLAAGSHQDAVAGLAALLPKLRAATVRITELQHRLMSGNERGGRDG